MPIFEFKCRDCGGVSTAIVFPTDDAAVRCGTCDGTRLDRLVSAPGLVRGGGSAAAAAGALRPIDPRRTVEHLSRSYDSAGIDPGRGFEEVARRAAAGDSPRELKAAVREAKKNAAPKIAGNGSSDP